MLACYSQSTEPSIPIYIVRTDDLLTWVSEKEHPIRPWISQVGFQAKMGEICVVPATSGGIHAVLLGVADDEDALQIGILASQLPAGNYSLAMDWNEDKLSLAVTAWGLASYQFTKYKSTLPYPAKLIIPAQCDSDEIQRNVKAMHNVRDWINTPTQDMMTHHLAAVANEIAQTYGAEYIQIEGVDLLTANFPMIYAVGKGSDSEPYLLDLRWGKSTDPKVTLVGKGVCFDAGGLDIKTAEGMRTMKKDMAGAAHVLGLAQMLMQAKLPIRLRVLLPVVENAVSGSSYHPSDVLHSRKGLTVEVTNTDAEGRLILADALTEAASENPELIIDIATLTGAARMALGNDIGAMFTDDETLAKDILDHAQKTQDPLWRLPIYQPYRGALESSVADLTNSSLTHNTGLAIIAAIFLREFVDSKIPWVHFDIMAWNVRKTAIGPEGGEVNGIRALYSYLKQRFL
jgi:leucyl aminopeptidase